MIMKKIARQEAEFLFQTSKVVSSQVEQDPGEMRILMKLSDRCSFLLKYDTIGHKKSYFLLCPKV